MNLYKAFLVPDSCIATVRNSNSINLVFLPVSKARTTNYIFSYNVQVRIYCIFIYLCLYKRPVRHYGGLPYTILF